MPGVKEGRCMLPVKYVHDVLRICVGVQLHSATIILPNWLLREMAERILCLRGIGTSDPSGRCCLGAGTVNYSFPQFSECVKPLGICINKILEFSPLLVSLPPGPKVLRDASCY